MKLIDNLVQKKTMLVVFGMFVLAFLIRVIQLGSVPFNFHEDEVLVGYVGRYILENGKDLYGNSWPLVYFNKFGDYYIIGPMYLAGMATYLFGVNEFGVRFTTAFFGSLVVFPLFALTNTTFKNKYVGILAAFFCAILPWHIILSRSSVEGIMGSTLFLGGVTWLFLYIRNGQVKNLMFASFLFLLSYWIYHPFRIYVPLVFLPFPFLFAEIRKRNKLMPFVITAAFFWILTIYISTTPWGSGRLGQTSIFSPISGVDIKIQEQIFNTGNERILEARMFHNKIIGYGREFVNQYITYFSPNFLFTTGGAESRYDIPDQGLLYITYLILMLAAFIPVKNKLQIENRYLIFLIYLIVIAPLPAALTYYGSPNIHRSALLGILLTIPVAAGTYKLLTIKYGRIAVGILTVVLLAEIAYFTHQYSVQSEVFNAIRRNDAHRELAQFIHENKDQFTNIYIPAEGNTALYYLFFSNDFNPAYSSQFKNDARIDQVENIHFIDSSCPTEKVQTKETNSLIIDRHNCEKNTGYQEVVKIKGKNELLGFTVYKK